MPGFAIYCDNRIEGTWFKRLSSEFRQADIRLISGRGKNPPGVEALILYDRPDIILEANGRVVLVLEKTREVPTGHNVGQRFARIVRAAEMRVPFFGFFPFDARKHGSYSSVCNLNIRLLKAFEKMSEIHDVPVVAINWPVDRHSELVDDGSEDRVIGRLVHSFVSDGFRAGNAAIGEELDHMRAEYARRLAVYPMYGNPPPSVALLGTREAIAMLETCLSAREAHLLNSRPRTVVYRIDMTPEHCRREDPYGGTQFIYDYLWCRSGKDVAEKHANLLLHFPSIPKDVWLLKNPNDPTRKSSLWYATANALIFSDGALLLR